MARRSFGARLGARIRARRQALGWSQGRLAEKTGITANYVGVLERGLKLPTLDLLVKLARVLGLEPAGLLGDGVADDAWLDELMAVARSIPEPRRTLALSLLRVIASQK